MTLSDLRPGFKGYGIFRSRILEKPRVLKTKVTIAQDEKYLTYGMEWYYYVW